MNMKTLGPMALLAAASYPAPSLTLGTDADPHATSGVPAVRQVSVADNGSQGGQGIQDHGVSTSFANPVQAGDSVWVVVTLSNYAGIHHNVGVRDSAGNTYLKLQELDDTNASTSQSVWAFYAANVTGGFSTVTMAVDIDNDADVEDFLGVAAVELSGVHTASLVGSSGQYQTVPASQADGISSGSIRGRGLQQILLAASMNGSALGSPGQINPGLGSGFSALAAGWGFNLSLGPLLTVESRDIDMAKSLRNGVFSPRSSSTNDYLTVGALFY